MFFKLFLNAACISDTVVMELVLAKQAILMKSCMAAYSANAVVALNSEKRKAPRWELYIVAGSKSLNYPASYEPS